MDFILDHLAIGNARESHEPPEAITALLCVAQEIELPGTDMFHQHKIPIIDMQPIPAVQLMEAVAWIRDSIGRHRIMVFCNAGVGRSTSVVIGYLCCIMGYRFGDAVEFVARRRPYMSILPNLLLTVDEVRARLKGQ